MNRPLLTLLAALGAIAFSLPQQDSARAHFERGRALYEEHDDSGDAQQEAQAEFRRALALDPKLAAAVAYLGFIAAENHPAEAEAAYRKALQIDPQSPDARVGLAWLHAGKGRFMEAIRELRLAVKADSVHRLARRELGFHLTAEGAQPTPEMWREAIESWKVLIRLDADDRDTHHDLARACEHLGDWAAAEHHYREVLRIGQTPEDLDVWVYSVHGNVAQMLERQGKYREAIREYEALIASEGVGAEEVSSARTRIDFLKHAPPGMC